MGQLLEIIMWRKRSRWSWTILAVALILQLCFETVLSASTGPEGGEGIVGTDGSEANVEVVPEAVQKYELNDLMSQLKYSKYLREVLELLKDDEELKEKINFVDLSTQSGNLADHLDKAHANIRTELDELKRQELYRIRQIGEELRRRGYTEQVIRNSVKLITRHLDLKHLSSFGTEDLRKLVLQANAELSILDQARREKFKEYEMHKVLEFEELYKRLKPAEQKEVEANKNALLAEHKRQKPVNMPASKDHFLKVWEERDKMNKENFNVKTFFHLHDLDGNKFLDEYEIKVLLENEVLDLYDQAAADYDHHEKQEDLERMREYAFNTIDTDKDHLINLDEFIANSKRTGFDDHVFWENVKRYPIFTPQEYAAYSELNRAEVKRMIDEGLISLPPSGIVEHKGDAEKGEAVPKKKERKLKDRNYGHVK